MPIHTTIASGEMIAIILGVSTVMLVILIAIRGARGQRAARRGVGGSVGGDSVWSGGARHDGGDSSGGDGDGGAGAGDGGGGGGGGGGD